MLGLTLPLVRILLIPHCIFLFDSIDSIRILRCCILHGRMPCSWGRRSFKLLLRTGYQQGLSTICCEALQIVRKQLIVAASGPKFRINFGWSTVI